MDLQDNVKRVLSDNPHDNVVVFSKEVERIRDNLEKARVKEYPDSDDTKNISSFYFKNAYFPYALYFIDTENHDAIAPARDKIPSYIPARLYRKKEHFLTNSKHTRSISVYMHSPYMPAPDAASPLLDDTILKSFIPEYDAYIYQKKNELIWFIGSDLDKDAEIVYHIYTDRTDLLPPKRQEYKFDNLGFKFGNAQYRIDSVGKYHVFKRGIPSAYPVQRIHCGIKSNKQVTYSEYFTTD